MNPSNSGRAPARAIASVVDAARRCRCGIVLAGADGPHEGLGATGNPGALRAERSLPSISARNGGSSRGRQPKRRPKWREVGPGDDDGVPGVARRCTRPGPGRTVSGPRRSRRKARCRSGPQGSGQRTGTIWKLSAPSRCCSTSTCSSTECSANVVELILAQVRPAAVLQLGEERPIGSRGAQRPCGSPCRWRRRRSRGLVVVPRSLPARRVRFRPRTR